MTQTINKNFTITPSSLVHYISCPSKSFFQRILKGKRDSIDASTGDAFHTLISAVLGSTNDIQGRWIYKPTKGDFLEEVRSILTDLLDGNRLPFYKLAKERELFLETLEILCSNVYDIFLDKFDDKIPVPMFVENELEVNYKSNINLLAKPDVLIKLKDGSHLILDWKTGNKLSENRISSTHMQNCAAYSVYTKYYPDLLENKFFSSVMEINIVKRTIKKVEYKIVDEAKLHSKYIGSEILEDYKKALESMISKYSDTRLLFLEIDRNLVQKVTSILGVKTGDHCINCEVGKKNCPAYPNSKPTEIISLKIYCDRLTKLKNQLTRIIFDW